MNVTIIKRFIDVMSGITLASALADLYLWITIEALIPSWTITVTGIFGVILMQALKKMIR